MKSLRARSDQKRWKIRDEVREDFKTCCEKALNKFGKRVKLEYGKEELQKTLWTCSHE